MTPKEKAEELYHKYFSMITIKSPIDKNASIPYVKRCILILVDEIISDYSNIRPMFIFKKPPRLKFWQEVKQEIEKL